MHQQLPCIMLNMDVKINIILHETLGQGVRDSEWDYPVDICFITTWPYTGYFIITIIIINNMTAMAITKYRQDVGPNGLSNKTLRS